MALEKKFAGRIPEETLTHFGFNVESLRKNDKIWDALEYGLKTPLLTFSAKLGNSEKTIPVTGRLHLYENKEGEIVPFIHSVRARVDLSTYKGHEFTKKEEGQLLGKGQLDRPVELKLGDKIEPCIVGVDKDTREIIHVPVKNIYMNNKILGAEITEQQVDIVKNGGVILVEGMIKNGKELGQIILQFDINKDVNFGGLSFTTATPELIQKARNFLEGRSELETVGEEKTQKADISNEVKEKMQKAVDTNQEGEKDIKSRGRGRRH